MFSGFIRKIKRPKGHGCTQSEWDAKIERERYKARAEERAMVQAEKKKERDQKIKAAAKKGKNALEVFAGDMYRTTKHAAKKVGQWGEWQGDEFLGKHEKKRRKARKVTAKRRKPTVTYTVTKPRKTTKKRTTKKRKTVNYEWV